MYRFLRFFHFFLRFGSGTTLSEQARTIFATVGPNWRLISRKRSLP